MTSLMNDHKPDVVGVSGLMNRADEPVSDSDSFKVDVGDSVRVVFPILEVNVGKGNDVSATI
jgi:hypothetical protein